MERSLIDSSLHVLRGGKTLLYPTDTIWGIGCDATGMEAVEKIYKIKERDHNKSMLVLANETMLSPTLPQMVRDLLLNSDRPTTVILPHEMLQIGLADNLPAQDGTVGVRIPKFEFCQTLLSSLGHPIVSTSANLSGRPSPAQYEDIEDEIKKRVDLALPNDPSFLHATMGSSRIIKLSEKGEMIVLR